MVGESLGDNRQPLLRRLPLNPVLSAPGSSIRGFEVWLLKADGTQILPAAYSCVPVPAVRGAPSSEEFSYRYSVADSTQAVAAAIRIDNEFYIEKLQPLESRPTGQ